MKCLRCGYCCMHYHVAIVKNPKLGIRDDNIVMHDGNGTPCIHLKGAKPGGFSCAIHDMAWYKETPCYAHGQVEEKNSNCRLGEHILKRRVMNQKGFTVEFIAVLAVIISVIVAIVIPVLAVRHAANSTSISSYGPNGFTESRCIEGYKFIVGSDGGARQMIDSLGKGIPCKNFDKRKD